MKIGTKTKGGDHIFNGIYIFSLKKDELLHTIHINPSYLLEQLVLTEVYVYIKSSLTSNEIQIVKLHIVKLTRR